MSTPTEFAIPVRQHVRQFLLVEFGPEPWRIHKNTFLGRTVGMKVEKLPFHQIARRPAVEGPAIRLTLPTALRHYTLTADSAKEVGAMLDKFFQQQLIQFVKGQVAATKNERAALRSFYKLYDIDPSHYDLEEARKVYRDYRDNVLRHNGHYNLMYGAEGRQELFSEFAIAS